MNSCLLSLMKLLLKSCSTKVCYCGCIVCPSMEAKYCDDCGVPVTVSHVCTHITCVCLFACSSQEPHVQTSPNFICMLPTTITQSSFLWYRCDTLWMTRVV